MQFKKRVFLFGSVVIIILYSFYVFKLDFGATKYNLERSAAFYPRKFLSPSQLQNLNASVLKSDRFNVLKDECDSGATRAQADVQLFDLYKERIQFDNVDGGAWKQGWNIQVDESRWNAHNKLKVFVVPHSHNDPGWTKTFEEFYVSQTRNIFQFMVTELLEDSSRKFIWAEVSFLSLWWSEASDEEKRKFKKLVTDGQIEIVSGGWVMPDEANSHYYSLIQQLTQGHQWLQKHLDYKPKRSWCIDPFGTSPTMPYLLQHFGLESLVIQRTHYSVKKYLAKNKQLEFRWRQLWDGSGRFDLLTHMMPFYSYDIPHTCGPDPAVCCQFDFRRSRTSGMVCPWKKQPEAITARNVARRAEMLLDQYRKKAELYSTNVLLVPLGDDFRYDVKDEWDLQYNNYQRLFDHMNSNPSWHVQAQFGTLDDYFEALRTEKTAEKFPSLSGDFFTYADRDDHYWSGYYTSKPFYKRMDRELISYLRSAEILHALAWKSSSPSHSDWMLSESSGLVRHLHDARASLSLFQHHDGITGTAKDFVVNDYARKLRRGMTDSLHVLQQSLNFLLTSDKAHYEVDPQSVYFDIGKSRKLPTGDSEYEVLKIDQVTSSKRVVIFNPLTHRRKEIVSLKVATYKNVELYDSNDRRVPCQISPFCEINEHSGRCFLLYFEVDILPLSVVTFFLRHAPHEGNNDNLASVTVLNANGLENELQWADADVRITYEQPVSDFFIENTKLSVTFRPDGLMKAVTLKEYDTTMLVHISFIQYGCKHGKEMCGAYLFLPSGDGRVVNCDNPTVKIVKGKLVSSVIVYCKYVVHAVHLFNTSGSDAYNVEIQNLVDIRTKPNFELAMRLSTGIKNEGIFYTDLNGMQIVKRQYLRKLPIQANFYPMPTSIFIQDVESRLTLLSAQPLGATSLNSGEVEVMQDRRLNQDDNLGLGQGVMDNRPVLHIFKLTIEKRAPSCREHPELDAAGRLSVQSYLASASILYPLLTFLQNDTQAGVNELLPSYTFVRSNEMADIDVHLVSVNTIGETRSLGAVLHRTDLDRCFHRDRLEQMCNGLVRVSSYVPADESDTIFTASPSFTQVYGRLNGTGSYPMCAMDLASFYVTKVHN